MNKIILVIGLVILLLISGCTDGIANGGYNDISLKDIEQANCTTIRQWYNDCDTGGMMLPKLSCRTKFLPYVIECIEKETCLK